MKKHVMIMVSVLLTVSLAACSTRQSNSNISNSQPDTFEPSAAESQKPDSNFQAESEPASPLVKAVQSIIEQYKNGTVDTKTGVPDSPGPTFNPVPEDFEFPDITSEADFEEVNHYEDIFVYIKGTGKTPYMNICIDSENYTVESVIFLPNLPDPQQEEPLIGDTESYQLLAANLIEQYKNNTIEINDMFPAPPEGFEFPENLSDLEFWQNEMGYFVTSIIDKNNTYEMYISIDDMTYDGVKPVENPHIDSVFFNKIS